MSNETWTPDRIAELTQLWTEGKSASQIATIMGGISRNAVLGKLHRMNIETGRFSAIAPLKKVKPLVAQAQFARKKADPVKAAAVKAIELRPPPPSIPKPLLVRLVDLGNHDCRWPVSGEKADTLFCGHNAEPGNSYCCGHVRLSVGKGTLSERNAIPARMVG